MEMVCVYCAVRVEQLNTFQAKFSVQARKLTEAVSRRPLEREDLGSIQGNSV